MNGVLNAPDSSAAAEVVQIKYMLLASDMRRAVGFYETVFGLSPKFVSEHWSELAWGDAIVALHGGHTGADHATGLSMQVRNAEAACDAIVRHGGRALNPPRQRAGEPILLADVADSEGNLFFVTEFVG